MIVPLRRDKYGNIISLDFNGSRYSFTLDEKGYVLNVSIGPIPPSYKLTVSVFRKHDPYNASTVSIYNQDMGLEAFVNNTQTLEVILPKGVYYINSSISYKGNVYRSGLIEINMSKDTQLGITFQFADLWKITFQDFRSHPLSNVNIIIFNDETGEKYEATSDVNGTVSFQDVYYGSWKIEALWNSIKVASSTEIVTDQHLESILSWQAFHDIKVIIVDQYGRPLQKITVVLSNPDLKFNLTKIMENQKEIIFEYVPKIPYKLTVIDKISKRSHMVDIPITQLAQQEITITIQTPLNLFLIYAIITFLTSVIVILTTYILKKKLTTKRNAREEFEKLKK